MNLSGTRKTEYRKHGPTTKTDLSRGWGRGLLRINKKPVVKFKMMESLRKGLDKEGWRM